MSQRRWLVRLPPHVILNGRASLDEQVVLSHAHAICCTCPAAFSKSSSERSHMQKSKYREKDSMAELRVRQYPSVEVLT